MNKKIYLLTTVSTLFFSPLIYASYNLPQECQELKILEPSSLSGGWRDKFSKIQYLAKMCYETHKDEDAKGMAELPPSVQNLNPLFKLLKEFQEAKNIQKLTSHLKIDLKSDPVIKENVYTFDNLFHQLSINKIDYKIDELARKGYKNPNNKGEILLGMNKEDLEKELKERTSNGDMIADEILNKYGDGDKLNELTLEDAVRKYNKLYDEVKNAKPLDSPELTISSEMSEKERNYIETIKQLRQEITHLKHLLSMSGSNISSTSSNDKSALILKELEEFLSNNYLTYRKFDSKDEDEPKGIIDIFDDFMDLSPSNPLINKFFEIIKQAITTTQGVNQKKSEKIVELYYQIQNDSRLNSYNNSKDEIEINYNFESIIRPTALKVKASIPKTANLELLMERPILLIYYMQLESLLSKNFTKNKLHVFSGMLKYSSYEDVCFVAYALKAFFKGILTDKKNPNNVDSLLHDAYSLIKSGGETRKVLPLNKFHVTDGLPKFVETIVREVSVKQDPKEVIEEALKSYKDSYDIVMKNIKEDSENLPLLKLLFWSAEQFEERNFTPSNVETLSDLLLTFSDTQLQALLYHFATIKLPLAVRENTIRRLFNTVNNMVMNPPENKRVGISADKMLMEKVLQKDTQSDLSTMKLKVGKIPDAPPPPPF